MDDQEAIETLMAGFDVVCQNARMIAMMPIEDWLEALEKGEAIAPFVDPSLYLRYVYSKKPEALKKVLRAALDLKRAVQSIQPDLKLILETEEQELRKHGYRK